MLDLESSVVQPYGSMDDTSSFLYGVIMMKIEESIDAETSLVQHGDMSEMTAAFY